MTQFNGIKSTFLGVSMQQHPDTIQAFNQLLNTVNLARIIELGTGEGGLTLFFGIYNYHRNWDCILRTYDRTALSSRNPRCYKLLRFLNVLIDRGDVLNDNRLIEYIKGIIATDGTTLLVCDDGDKEREFNLYAPSLKDGDIIMVHDYVAKGKEHVWGFPEVNINNVMGVSVKYNLKPFMQSVFDEVAWLCRRKADGQVSR